MLVRETQFLNARPSIDVTPFGMIKWLSFFPGAYLINSLPSFEYKLPSIDVKFLFSSLTIMRSIFPRLCGIVLLTPCENSILSMSQ